VADGHQRMVRSGYYSVRESDLVGTVVGAWLVFSESVGLKA